MYDGRDYLQPMLEESSDKLPFSGFVFLLFQSFGFGYFVWKKLVKQICLFDIAFLPTANPLIQT